MNGFERHPYIPNSVPEVQQEMLQELGMSSLGPIQYDDGYRKCIPGQRLWQRKHYSGEIAYEIDKEIRKIINECYDRAKQILRITRIC